MMNLQWTFPFSKKIKFIWWPDPKELSIRDFWEQLTQAISMRHTGMLRLESGIELTTACTIIIRILWSENAIFAEDGSRASPSSVYLSMHAMSIFGSVVFILDKTFPDLDSHLGIFEISSTDQKADHRKCLGRMDTQRDLQTADRVDSDSHWRTKGNGKADRHPPWNDSPKQYHPRPDINRLDWPTSCERFRRKNHLNSRNGQIRKSWWRKV
jgi:hypothetical protein